MLVKSRFARQYYEAERWWIIEPPGSPMPPIDHKRLRRSYHKPLLGQRRWTGWECYNPKTGRWKTVNDGDWFVRLNTRTVHIDHDTFMECFEIEGRL